jgi:hypothetical protein
LKILLLIGFFDSFLFPRNILLEDHFNPAHLHQERFEIVVASERRFELAELQTFGVYSQIKNYSVKAVSFGNDVYRENFLEFGFGFPLAKKFAIGVNVAGLNTWIKDFRNEFAYSIKTGGQFKSDRFLIGIWVNNLNQPRISSDDYAPISYSVRFGYQAQENFNFGFRMRGVETGLPFYNFGFSFLPHEMAVLGVSVNTKPILLEYGIRITLGSVFLGYSGSRHRQLGLTHNLGLGYSR